MKRRWLGLVAAALMMSFGFWVLNRTGIGTVANSPRFQGKSIEEWADLGVDAAMAEPQDRPNALLASNAIHQIGGAAIAWLQTTTPKISDLRLALLEKLPAPSVVKRPVVDRAIRDVRRSLFVLYSLDGATTPFLWELPTNSVVRPGYATFLGPAALPVIIPALTNSTSATVKNHLLDQIALWGPTASQAGPLLWQKWERNQIPADPDRWILALAATGYRGDELVSRLMSRFTYSTNFFQEFRETMPLLAIAGRPGSERLVSLLRHADPQIQRHAFVALFCPRHTLRQQGVLPTIGGSQNHGPKVVISNVVPQSTWQAVEQAPVATRLRAVELAAERYAQPALFPDSAPIDIHSVLVWFRHDPDPQVSQTAANALDGFHLLKAR